MLIDILHTPLNALELMLGFCLKNLTRLSKFGKILHILTRDQIEATA